MKKSLLIIMAVCLCASLMAQDKIITRDRMSASYSSTIPENAGTQFEVTEVTQIPMLSANPLITSGELYDIIGLTHYNTPTNSSARSVVSFRKNSNDAAVVWTMSSINSPTRGTGINYFNVNKNEWDPNPPVTGRIETIRTGWGTHAFTEQGEIVVAHDALTGLVINTRDKWGEGDWNEKMLIGPKYKLKDITGKWDTAATKLNWPAMATNGNTVHLLCVTDAWTNTTTGGVSYLEDQFPDTENAHHGGYKGFNSYPMYYRSLDGGKNWEEVVDFGQSGLKLLTNYQTFKFGGDQYDVAVKDDHVVILFYSLLGFVIYLESFDNGENWVKKTVFDRGEVFLGSYSPEVEPLLAPTTATIAIDDDDQVHVAFATHAIHKNENAAVDVGIGFWDQMPTGMVYWNDSMEPIDWEDIRGWCDAEGKLTDYNWDLCSHYIPVPTVVGFEEFYNWNFGPSYDKNQFKHNGWATFPRIIAKDDRVYLSFQSPLDYPFGFTSPDLYCRGIFVTVSDDNGTSWDVQKNTSWISYKPDLQWADWTEYVPPVIDENITVQQLQDAMAKIYIDFQAEQGYPTMSCNTKGDMFMAQWLYHHLSPFPNDGNTVFEVNPMSVYTLTQNLKNLPAYKNIDDIWRGNWTNEEEPEINFPDLGCERPVKITFETCTSEDGEEYRAAIIYWKQPEYINVPLSSYNIYRDGNKIGSVPYSITTPGLYIDSEVEEGTYTYQVSAVYEGGCESTLSRAKTFTLGDNPVYYEVCGTAVKDIPAQTFKLYPNPTNGNVTIAIDADSPYTLTVSNIMGQAVFSTYGNSKEVKFSVSNYAPGVYIVNVKTANAITTQKLIVK